MNLTRLDRRVFLSLKWSPAISKTGLGATRRGAVIHHVHDLRTAVIERHIRYDANWACSPEVQRWDIIPLLSQDALPTLCVRCQGVSEGPAVYRCYDAAGRLLYIGSTINRRIRLKLHESRSQWWGEVMRTEMTDYPHITAARFAETHAIAAESPLYNIMGRPAGGAS